MTLFKEEIYKMRIFTKTKKTNMLSKNDIKTIKSLEQKKFRNEFNLFTAEGPKLVGDLAGQFECCFLAATPAWLDSNRHIRAERIERISRDELEKISFLKTPQDVLALFRIPKYDFNTAQAASERLLLALDGIQDPGNLGTIVRIADWFGINDIICSRNTADIYNPKSVQATMGALSRVRLHYLDLEHELSNLRPGTPVYGTFLDGDNMYSGNISGNGIIVMGNEGNGISSQVGRLVSHRLFIPNWPEGAKTSESLNVAVATAIVCAEFRRPR